MKREIIILSQCECDQLVEATEMWFARGGGAINAKIKKVELLHEHDYAGSIMPPDWNKHEPSKEVLKW